MWVVMAMVAIGAGVFAYRAATPKGVVGSNAASELFYQQTLRGADGIEHAMRDLRGKLVIVNFWATWCVPCVQEIPAFSQAQLAAGRDVVFVGLGIDSSENIAAFAARLKPSYPLLAAGAIGTELARAFGDEAGALPFTVVLRQDGSLVGSHLGRVDDALLARWIATPR